MKKISIILTFVLMLSFCGCGNDVTSQKVEAEKNTQKTVTTTENKNYEFTNANGPKKGAYTGDWKDGLPNGKGKFVRNDGILYEGDWKDGLPNGEFVFGFENGENYKGQVKDGLFHGKGIYTFSDGVVQSGEWENDKLISQGIYNIGDIVQIGNINITVNRAKKSTEDSFIKPNKGNLYYAVDLTLENKSSEPFASSTILQMSLSDKEGYKYNVSFGAKTKGSLDGEIGAGRKLRGQVLFEIPRSATGLEFVYDYSIVSSGQVIFKLDR